MTELTQLTVETVRDAIGIPVDQWPSNCYAIAYQIVDADLVKGVPRYGHYYGPVAAGSIFAYRAQRLPFIPHGWVELTGSRDGVLDPTRWVFEDRDPYIFIGAGDEYDAGGNRWRRATMQPPPAYDPEDRRVPLAFDRAVEDAVLALLGAPPAITMPMAFWLANLPLDMLHGIARPVYQAFVDAGPAMAALLPIDNQRMVLGKQCSRSVQVEGNKLTKRRSRDSCHTRR